MNNSFVRTALKMSDLGGMATPVMDKGSEINKMIDVERASTSKDCTLRFFKTIAIFSTPSMRGLVSGITIQAVGLRVGPERRRGSFDLFWFPSEPSAVYAVDSRDTNVVYRAEASSGTMLGAVTFTR